MRFAARPVVVRGGGAGAVVLLAGFGFLDFRCLLLELAWAAPSLWPSSSLLLINGNCKCSALTHQLKCSPGLPILGRDFNMDLILLNDVNA